MGIFPKIRGENIKCLKPPPSDSTCEHVKLTDVRFGCTPNVYIKYAYSSGNPDRQNKPHRILMFKSLCIICCLIPSCPSQKARGWKLTGEFDWNHDFQTFRKLFFFCVLLFVSTTNSPKWPTTPPSKTGPKRKNIVFQPQCVQVPAVCFRYRVLHSLKLT